MCVSISPGYVKFVNPSKYLPLISDQAMAESNGRIDGQKAHALASTNLEKLLGIINLIPDLVAYEGGDAFNLSSKVVAVLSSDRGIVDLM